MSSGSRDLQGLDELVDEVAEEARDFVLRILEAGLDDGSVGVLALVLARVSMSMALRDERDLEKRPIVVGCVRCSLAVSRDNWLVYSFWKAAIDRVCSV